MNALWQEVADGIFFPRREKFSAAVESKLQMLSLDDGTLIPFDKVVTLDEEDAELLSLPPRNPYQLSIRTRSFIGGKNFRYVVEVLNADDQPLTNPQITGALLHVGANTYRLTVKQIQQHAAAADARIDSYISDSNKKIVVPDKLRVDFMEMTGGRVKVQPVMLQERDGKFEPIDSADFQGTFDKRGVRLRLLRPRRRREKMFALWQIGYRGILVADDMGLGKTLQTLTFIGALKKFGALKSPVLIVAPASLLTNWHAEYKKFLRGKIFDSVIFLHGDGLKNFLTDELALNGKKKLSLRKLSTDSPALTTYETLRDYQFSFAEIPWSVIVADEAQKIKNPDAGVTKALKAMKYDFAVCLSGTPVENTWVDLWSIVDFVQPAHIGDLKTFREKFLEPVTGDAATIHKLGTQLKAALRPLMLRRMKDDNLPALPAKKIFRCPQEMPRYQREIYSAVLERYRRGGFSTPLEFLKRLREISLHPDLPTMATEKFFALPADDVIKRSARLIKTFALLDEIKIRGEKVLLFVTSRKMQLILRHLLTEKFATEILPPVNGTLTGAKRQELIDKFRATTGFNALILSPEAAGVGFTVTEANNVIHLERTWNPAKENQATDCVYRIGQRLAVNVYLPLAVDKNLRGKSFDENLDDLLTFKKFLGDNVLFPTAETAADYKTLATIPATEISAACWTIDAVDDVDGFTFEKIIAELFDAQENFSAKATPATNDYGADVVVESSTDSGGLLIQCKHTSNLDKSVGGDGVKEICAAVAHYEKIFRGRKFQPVVITNAKKFSAGAIELARANGVRLIVRRELENLFSTHKILRCI